VACIGKSQRCIQNSDEEPSWKMSTCQIGRPKMKWKVNIKMDDRETGCDRR
jgi:hypothetical protein